MRTTDWNKGASSLGRRKFLRDSSVTVAAGALSIFQPGQARPEVSKADWMLSNKFLSLGFKAVDGKLNLDVLVNHLTQEPLKLAHSDGFILHLGELQPQATREAVALRDFELTGSKKDERSMTFDLQDSNRQIGCRWHWELSPEDPYARSWIEVKNLGNKALHVADVSVLTLRYGTTPPGVGLGATAEADSEQTHAVPYTSAWSAIDGNPNTFWEPRSSGQPGEGRPPTPHWLQLTFAKPIEVGSIVIRSVKEVQLQDLEVRTLEGPERWITLGTTYNNASSEAKIVFSRPAAIGYLRVVINRALYQGARDTKETNVVISEVEVYDARGRQLPLFSNTEIPNQRSTAFGDGEGVALTAQSSIFAALEALLYDYPMGVSRDGKGLRLGHNPGWALEPGASAASKKAVLGVGTRGEAGRWFVERYLTPNSRQRKQGDRQWDRFWCYNSVEDNNWSLRTSELLTLTKALAKTREAYGFRFRYVGPDETTFVTYDPFHLGLNDVLFPDGFAKDAEAIEATGASVEGYYGVGRVQDVKTPKARQHYRDTLFDLVDRYRIRLLIFDSYVGGYGGNDVYWREQVWDNFRETIEALQAKYPDLFIGLESVSPNLLSRWLWVNSQFDHLSAHYQRYNPDSHLNNVRAELIPDAGAGSAPVLHSRDVVTASSGVYDLYGVPWRGVETFGPLWQLVYDPFNDGASAMERSRDNWVMNLFGSATVISPITYGRFFGQPPEDLSWLGRMLKLRDDNLEVLKECVAKENGDIFHCKQHRGFLVFRHLCWEETSAKSFTLGQEIGLTARDPDYVIRQLYPTERVLTKPTGEWRWRFGDRVSLSLNPFELRLLMIEPLSSFKQPAVVGCDFESDSQGHITLLGLPGEHYRINAVVGGQPVGDPSELTFEGLKNSDLWYKRLTSPARMPESEKHQRQKELLERIDFVKAAGYPAAWRESNVYGLLEYHRQHPYPEPEIEAAREIRHEVVHESKRWFCDDDLETPPLEPCKKGLIHFPLLVGTGVIQADLGQILDVGRVRVAVTTRPAEVTVSLSPDGHKWYRASLAQDREFWDSGVIDRSARYCRLEAEDLTVQEFQVSAKDPAGNLQLLDWSKIEPYPISFVRGLTRQGDVTEVWKTAFRLPDQTYDGQEIALPVWLHDNALLFELWALYSVGGDERSAYRIVPGYAKARDWLSGQVNGLTFKLPIFATDAGKELELILVSAKLVDRAEAWLVSDPLPYSRRSWQSLVPLTQRGA
jgi:hypothetical protein